MNWHRVRLDDVAPQPWRNGGGVTRELLAWPSAADWRVRISVAEVAADGPFSRFEGVERWFAVLEGDGVVLTVDGEERVVRPASPPARFDGGAQVDARLLGGPTRDLNLMAPPGRGRMWRAGAASDVEAGRLVAVYDDEARTLPWALAPAALRLVPPGPDAWCMEVQP